MDLTHFDDDETGGLGPLSLAHPSGTFPPSPATRTALQTIGRHRDLLSGRGLDWGCGIGALAINAARLPTVELVVGVDIAPAHVTTSRANADRNGVSPKTRFIHADSVAPVDPLDQTFIDGLAGTLGFVTSNAPASEEDDGFGYRRTVLSDTAPLLRDGGVVFLSISSQYGKNRVDALTDEAPGFHHEGVLASTSPVPFDLERPDLRRTLEVFVAEESRGGDPYEFVVREGRVISATEALAVYESEGRSPLTRWQVHLFRRRA